MTTASYHGANYTVIDNLPSVASFLNANEWGGVVKAVTDTFTATAGDTGSSGSFIYVGKLPKGAVPLNVVVTAENAQTWGGTIGYTNAEDALGDFAVFTVAGSKVTGPDPDGVASTPLTEAKDVYIKTATESIANGDSITTSIFYIQGA